MVYASHMHARMCINICTSSPGHSPACMPSTQHGMHKLPACTPLFVTSYHFIICTHNLIQSLPRTELKVRDMVGEEPRGAGNITGTTYLLH